MPSAAAADVRITEVGELTPPIHVEQLVYDAPHQLLIARNSASTIAVIELGDGSSTLHMSTYQFTDLSLSPQGGVLYAADYGGEQIGYGQPARQHYVHRLDLATGSWAVQTARLAGNVEAVDDQTFVLKSNDQWVTFTYNAWGTGSAIMQLNPDQNSFPGYYASVYGGDFVYAAASKRLIHGNQGLSSQELQAFRVVGNDFAKQEGSGVYGSAQGHGGSLCLSTDGSALYYGELSVDALDVTHSRRTFAAPIFAATPDVAFAQDDYYDVRSGNQIDSLAFPSIVYALDTAGSELWAYDEATTTLHHYTISVDGKPPTSLDAGMPSALMDAATATGDGGEPLPDAALADASSPLQDGGDAVVADAASRLDASGSSDEGYGRLRKGEDLEGCALATRADAPTALAALAFLLLRRRRRT